MPDRRRTRRRRRCSRPATPTPAARADARSPRARPTDAPKSSRDAVRRDAAARPDAAAPRPSRAVPDVHGLRSATRCVRCTVPASACSSPRGGATGSPTTSPRPESWLRRAPSFDCSSTTECTLDDRTTIVAGARRGRTPRRAPRRVPSADRRNHRRQSRRAARRRCSSPCAAPSATVTIFSTPRREAGAVAAIVDDPSRTDAAGARRQRHAPRGRGRRRGGVRLSRARAAARRRHRHERQDDDGQHAAPSARRRPTDRAARRSARSAC